MIQLNCTNCKSLLQIDDAFAGGVCRCRYCGTIQTVPKRLKKTSAGAQSPAIQQVEAGANGGSSSKTLFSKKGGIETAGSGTGLDDLADIVASSGLTSNRLQKNTPVQPPVTPKVPANPWDRRTVTLLASAAGVIALLLVIILILAFRDRSAGTVASTDQGTGQRTPPAGDGQGTPPLHPTAAGSASFLGQPIEGKTLAFVLDRGAYSGELHRLENLKAAVVNCVKSLGPDRRFQIVFWGVSDEPPMAYPPEGPRPATAENLNGLPAFLDQVYAVGFTQEVTALHAALKSKPDAVVFVPIRGLLDGQTLARRVIGGGAGQKPEARFYCFTLEQPDWAQSMRQIAEATKGFYRDVPLAELNKFANP